MQQINIYDAKMRFSHLVDRASRGESFIIAKAGTPLARLVPLQGAARPKIRLGLMQGKIHMRRSFDEPLPDELLKEFEGDR